MFYFFYGSDLFALKEAVEKKKAVFFKSNPNAVTSRFNLDEEEGFHKLKQTLETKSLFGESIFLVANSCFSENLETEKLLEILKNYVQNPDKNILPVFCQTGSSGELSKKNKELFNFLSKKSVENKEVASSKSPVLPTVSNFNLTDAIASKNRQKAILVLDKLLSQGEDPNSILALIVFQFRALLRVKSLVKQAVPLANMISLTKLHPFVVTKAHSQSKNFELEELKKIYGQLSFLDISSKKGRVNLTDAIFELILQNLK